MRSKVYMLHEQQSERCCCADCNSCFGQQHVHRVAVYQKIQMTKESTWFFDFRIINPRYFDCYLFAFSAIVHP